MLIKCQYQCIIQVKVLLNELKLYFALKTKQAIQQDHCLNVLHPINIMEWFAVVDDKVEAPIYGMVTAEP